MSDNRNLWKIQSKDEIYDCYRYKLVEYNTLNPAGNEMDYPVLHFKQYSTAVCAVDEDGYLYLVGQWRFGAGYYSWEVVEGRSDKGEEPAETIKRELKEEAGITAKTWDYLGMMYPNNVLSDEEMHYFVARDLTIGDNSPDDYEKLVIKKMHFMDFLQDVIDGKVKDGPTSTCVMLTYFKLKSWLDNF